MRVLIYYDLTEYLICCNLCLQASWSQAWYRGHQAGATNSSPVRWPQSICFSVQPGVQNVGRRQDGELGEDDGTSGPGLNR